MSPAYHILYMFDIFLWGANSEEYQNFPFITSPSISTKPHYSTFAELSIKAQNILGQVELTWASAHIDGLVTQFINTICIYCLDFKQDTWW